MLFRYKFVLKFPTFTCSFEKTIKMKKFLSLLCLLQLTLVAVQDLRAQSSFHSFDATAYVYGDTSLQSSSVKIVNTGTSTISAKVSQNAFSAVPGHVTYFCWGVICYPPTVTVSLTPVVLAPGDTTTSFIGYLHPTGITGVSEVTYNFFNEADESDSLSLIVTYDITLTGIDNIEREASLSDASPNPAAGLTSISYDLNTSKNAKLVIYNILGSVVKEESLDTKQGTVILSTSGLNSGIYYYSILADGKLLPAKKLIVARK